MSVLVVQHSLRGPGQIQPFPCAGDSHIHQSSFLFQTLDAVFQEVDAQTGTGEGHGAEEVAADGEGQGAALGVVVEVADADIDQGGGADCVGHNLAGVGAGEEGGAGVLGLVVDIVIVAVEHPGGGEGAATIVEEAEHLVRLGDGHVVGVVTHVVGNPNHT